MKQDILWIVPFILALILEPILRIIGFIWTMVRSKNRFDYIQECTNNIDQTVNAFCRELFSDLWVKDEGYKLGVVDYAYSQSNEDFLVHLTEAYVLSLPSINVQCSAGGIVIMNYVSTVRLIKRQVCKLNFNLESTKQQLP
jgi:hypothetical protein